MAAMDQKKLRELMKKEKERRGQGAAPAAPARVAPGRATKVAPAVAEVPRAATVAPAKAPVAAPAEAAAAPKALASLVGGGDDSEEEEAPEALEEGPPGPAPLAVAADALALVPEAAPQAAEEPADQPEGLPAGFFDDPDLDAKARGVEGPTARAKRELEDGIKRFEKEMLLEQERADETRHELDEEKAEEQMAEEEELQSHLLGRLSKLREMAAKRPKLSTPKEAVSQAEDEEEISDAELDVDWRAKGFT